MITHHQPQSLSSPNPLCTVYKLILYHPLNPWCFAHDPTPHRLQAHPVSSTEPTLFRPLSHPALSLNPPYIASSPTSSTRSSKAFFFTTHKKRRSKKLLSFTSSSLISISRPTPLMRDYPIIGRSVFIPFYLWGEDGVSPFVLLSYIDWTNAVHCTLWILCTLSISCKNLIPFTNIRNKCCCCCCITSSSKPIGTLRTRFR